MTFNSCSSRDNDMSANTTSQSASMSSTLAFIKSSFIAKVNHTAVRRQRSAVDTCVSDVTSVQTDVTTEVAVGQRAGEGRGSAPTQSGVRRRRIRSPFRLLTEPNKPARSSLAEQRIIESVVFRPSATSSSGRSAARQLRDTGNDDAATTTTTSSQRQTADVTTGVAASSDKVVERQGVAVVKRSMSQGQGQCRDPAGQTSSSATLVRSVSTNNAHEPLLLSVNGNFTELP